MKESTTIAFTGDIGFDKYMDKKWEDDALLAPGILEFLTSADHVVANVEGPLVDNTATLMQAAEMRLMHTIKQSVSSCSYIRINSRMLQKHSGKTISMKKSAVAVCRVRLWISRLSIRLPRKRLKVHGKSVSWKLSKHIFWNRCKQDTKIISYLNNCGDIMETPGKITVAIFRINDIMEQVG